MLLDDFCQIPSPCLLVLFGNEWRTLLTIEGVPGEWFEVEAPEEGFVLGVVKFHNMFMIIIRDYSLNQMLLSLQVSFSSQSCQHPVSN